MSNMRVHSGIETVDTLRILGKRGEACLSSGNRIVLHAMPALRGVMRTAQEELSTFRTGERGPVLATWRDTETRCLTAPKDT